MSALEVDEQDEGDDEDCGHGQPEVAPQLPRDHLVRLPSRIYLETKGGRREEGKSFRVSWIVCIRFHTWESEKVYDVMLASRMAPSTMAFACMCSPAPENGANPRYPSTVTYKRDTRNG